MRAPDTVGEIMTKEVVAVAPGDPVRAAVREMVDHEIGAVVVAEGTRAVGVFTERDLARRILDDPGLLDRPVGEVMSAPVVSTEPDVEIVAAFDLMNAKQVRRLPVVEGARLVGVVTERDLLRWVTWVASE